MTSYLVIRNTIFSALRGCVGESFEYVVVNSGWDKKEIRKVVNKVNETILNKNDT